MMLRKAYRTTMTIMLALTITAGCASAENSSSTETSNSEHADSGKTADSANNTPDTSQSDKPEGTDPEHANQNPDHTKTPNNANNGGKQTNEASPAEPSEPAKPVQETIEKLYRMNSVYSFVPINKEATSSKVVLLTFDDGPKADKTVTSLLDTLDKHKAKAIFFVNGYRVKSHPELLKKIADRGQAIGNHSWDHIDLKKETEETVKKQIGDVQDIVKKVTGKDPIFFRPPFGSGNDTVKGIARGHGMLYMTWSDGSLDWDSSTKNKPDKVIANVLDQLHPGVNILMHELPWTTEALDDLLTKLEAKGYGFIDPATIDLGLKQPAKSAK